ncbi:hypothetical protein DES32_2790 [Methylovirgula ligni]|uniref:Uncharacterized protein n=1 Tax=Methylovirgula ligni TaxID=569860 RepID=A0A3D9Z0H2_9HYPH|nr:hypothetical protein DES32_2790 [Methylovirgula ligni]
MAERAAKQTVSIPDCFAEFAIGPAEGQTRWLAMTIVLPRAYFRCLARNLFSSNMVADFLPKTA